MKETIWTQFDLAEVCGVNTIRGLAETDFDQYKDDIEWLTMLVMVLNHKCWSHHDKGNENLCELYSELYYRYYEKSINMLEAECRDEDLTYFIRTLD